MTLKRAGRSALIIRGHQLNFEELEQQLGMQAIDRDKKREGNVISTVLPPLPMDVITFKKIINDGDSPDDVVNSFVSYLLSTNYDFLELSKTCDVILNCFIQSDYAQIGFDFSADTLQKISLLGLGFDISIFSWGGVDDDSEEDDNVIE